MRNHFLLDSAFAELSFNILLNILNFILALQRRDYANMCNIFGVWLYFQRLNVFSQFVLVIDWPESVNLPNVSGNINVLPANK